MITYYYETFLQFEPEKCGKAFITAGLLSFIALTAHGEHTMDIGSIEGFIDFLMLLNMAELFNALYMPSYNENGVSVWEMLHFIEARRLCHMILTWFSTHYDLLYGDNLKMPPYDLQKKYFNGQIRALLHYKHLEEMDLQEIEKNGGLYSPPPILRGVQGQSEQSKWIVLGLYSDFFLAEDQAKHKCPSPNSVLGLS